MNYLLIFCVLLCILIYFSSFSSAIASLLLKVNAKNDHKNKNGKTALDIARVDKRMMRLMNDPTGNIIRKNSSHNDLHNYNNK